MRMFKIIVYISIVLVICSRLSEAETISASHLRMDIQLDERPLALSQLAITGDSLCIPVTFTIEGTQWLPSASPQRVHDGKYTQDGSAGDIKATLFVEMVNDRTAHLSLIPSDGSFHTGCIGLNVRDNFFGTGERFVGFDMVRRLVRCSTIDPFGNKGTGAYKSVPFFSGKLGYGIEFDHDVEVLIDFNLRDRYWVYADLEDDHFGFYYYAGPNLTDVLAAYTARIGRPKMPPRWSFAPIMGRNVYRTQEDVCLDVDYARKYHIPCGAVLIDSPWETGYNDFNWDTKQFAHPKVMLDYIKNAGMKTLLWITPLVNIINSTDGLGTYASKCTNFDEGARNGFFVKNKEGEPVLTSWWKGKGAMVDFTNPAASRWWKNQLKRVIDIGVSGIKCDDCEGQFVPNGLFYDGTPYSRMKQRMAYLYQKATLEAFEEAGVEGMLLSRSAWTGCQSLSFYMNGDPRADFSLDEGLPIEVFAVQSMAMSGFPFWSSMIGGSVGHPSPEVFIRWCQFGAFTPGMHFCQMPPSTGPWDFGEEAVDIYRRFARIHTSLYPYREVLAREAVENGIPPVRPMVLAFQEDEEAWRNVMQYMLGSSILVAPVTSYTRSKQVYLPPGTWYDWWTGKPYKGRQYMVHPAPLNRIPLFVKEGSIIPRIHHETETLLTRGEVPDKSVRTYDPDQILYDIYPTYTGVCHLSSNRYMETSREGEKLVLNVKDKPGNCVILKVMFTDISDCALDGKPLTTLFNTYDSNMGWLNHPDGRGALVRLKIPDSGRSEVTVYF